MSVLKEVGHTSTGQFHKHTQTTVMDPTASALDSYCVPFSNKQAWNNLIDNRLLEWKRNPANLADEDITPPSSHVIDIAIQFTAGLRDRGCSTPSSMVPNGEGGIVFEWKADTIFETIEIHSNGSIELMRFKDCKLQSRRRLYGPSIH